MNANNFPLSARHRSSFIGIFVIGITLLILGAFIFVLAFSLAPHEASKAPVFTGYSVFWVGFPTLVTGTLGVIAGVKKQKGQVIAFMVLSILTCLVAAAMAVIMPLILAIGCALGGKCRNPDRKVQLAMSFYITLTIDAVLVFCACLTGAILTCVVGCQCCGNQANDKEPEVITLTTPTARAHGDEFDSKPPAMYGSAGASEPFSMIPMTK